MSLFRSAGNAVGGILNGVDEFTSSFKERAEKRKADDVKKADAERKKEAQAVLERNREKASANLQARREALPVDVEIAEAASGLRNSNADQDANRRLNEMDATAGHVQSAMGVAGDQNRQTIDTTFGAQGKLDTTKVSNWANIAVPATERLIKTQAGIDTAMTAQIMGGTPLVEQLVGEQRADRALARYAIDQENKLGMDKIWQAVVGTGLLFT